MTFTGRSLTAEYKRERVDVNGESISLSVSRANRVAEKSEQEHTGDALVSSADEGRGTLRKASTSRVQT